MIKNIFSKKHVQGNILFLILIAVALFAALSYAVTSTSRTGGGAIESEKAKITEGELNYYLAEIEQGRSRLTLINRCNSIDYTIPADQSPTGNKTCHLFHPDGGGVVYRDLVSSCDLAGINNLAIGEACNGIIYAGMSGGNRIYTTASDQGSASWNNGTASFSYMTGATSYDNGLSNTDNLIGITTGEEAYNAAETCRALGNEWYLPSENELLVLYASKDLIGGFSVLRYWTSTQNHPLSAKVVRFSDGFFGHGESKNIALPIRCVRRD